MSLSGKGLRGTLLLIMVHERSSLMDIGLFGYNAEKSDSAILNTMLASKIYMTFAIFYTLAYTFTSFE